MSTVGRCTTCSNMTTLITQQITTNEVFPSNLSIAVNTSVCVYSTQNCQYYNTFGYC